MKPVLVLAILAVLFLRLADSVPRPLNVVTASVR
nr:US3ii/US3iv protein [Human betaherpesvirus 5]